MTLLLRLGQLDWLESDLYRIGLVGEVGEGESAVRGVEEGSVEFECSMVEGTGDLEVAD